MCHATSPPAVIDYESESAILPITLAADAGEFSSSQPCQDEMQAARPTMQRVLQDLGQVAHWLGTG